MINLEAATATKSTATVEELVAATKDAGIRQILVRGDLANAPSIRLSPGQSLQGEGDKSKITFAPGTMAFSFLRTTGFIMFVFTPPRISARSSMTQRWTAWGGSNCEM